MILEFMRNMFQFRGGRSEIRAFDPEVRFFGFRVLGL